MFRRRRPLARAAMVGGGAYMLGKHRARGQAQEEEQNAQIDELQQQQYQQPAPAAPAPSGGISDDLVSQLEKLGKLKDEGVLTQEEFDAQKKKLLEAT
jgi:hypothetical protein